MKNIKKISGMFGIVFLLAITLFPNYGYSQINESNDSKTGKTGITYECGDGITAGNCSFDDLVAAVKKALDFGIKFALSFSVVVIAYAGYRYMISGDNPGERKKANEMLWKVALGIVYILAAWLIVTLITNALLTEDVKKLVPLK